MTSTPPMRPRGPRVFSADDPSLVAAPPTSTEADPAVAERRVVEESTLRVPTRVDLAKTWSWGTLFFSAMMALSGLALTLWFTRFVSVTLAREDWIGWLATGLLGVMALAAAVLLLREIVGLFRLRRITQLRRDADAAKIGEDKKLAVSAVKRLKALMRDREELAWGHKRLADHERDVLSATELLRLADRELVTPLDRDARRAVVHSAKRIATVTAMSPWALLTTGFVLFENLAMLRKIATIYGGRPGFSGSLRLARLVVTHIILTGGLALTDDLLHQFLGQDLVRRLSQRLGEGVFNGTLTARVGTAALAVCRPLPFLETPEPRLRDVVKEVFKKDAEAAASEKAA
jgi:putative membrane protein